MTADEMIAEYVSLSMEFIHPLKTHARAKQKLGKPVGSRMLFLHRRLIEMIGETATNSRIQNATRAYHLLRGPIT